MSTTNEKNFDMTGSIGDDRNQLASGEYNSTGADNSSAIPQYVEVASDGNNIAAEEDTRIYTNDSDEYTTYSEECGHEETTETAPKEIKEEYFFTLVRKTRRRCDDLELPKTVSLLEGPAGEKLYLIGTAHFSKESCEDVQKVISMVQPDAVVVELCSARTQTLTVDEAELIKLSDESGFGQLQKCVKQKGLLSGLVLYTMLYMSAHITKQLGMPPGSEFRTAFQESRKIPGCQFYLGDRSISITLHRMLAALSLWQKLRFGLMLLQELKPISAEDVEKLKEQDMFEQLLQEMVVEFPHMANVLVAERDMYISGFLQHIVKTPVYLPGHVVTPPVVVGVFGIGHCNGIKANFPKEITAEQLEEIQRVPPPSKMRKVIRFSMKGALFLATIYSAYKLTGWLGIYSKLKRWM